jgi:cytochrome c peroxidase
MKKLIPVLIIAVAFCSFLLDACRKKDKAPSATPMSLTIPGGFPAAITVFQNNPLTKEGFELGRKLFYDGRLSVDGNFPCSSCHNQAAGFGTYDHDLSHGYNDQHTTRNAPPIFNLAWQKSFHWDGGITKLEDVAPVHITAPNEMAEKIDNVIGKLKTDAVYNNMFYAAFGDNIITAEKIYKSLAQFTGAIVSANSKYDRVKQGKESFTLTEQQGYEVFKTNCNSCHTEPLFTDFSYRTIGMDLNILKDAGRMKITGLKEDSLKFRVPTLRNIGRTYPYMHDGQLYSLEDVLNHYAGLNTSFPNLDPLLKNRIILNANEKNALKIFLYTLTDEEFLANKAYEHIH